MATDEEQALIDALRNERDYEDRVYRTRAYMGTAASLNQGFLNYLAKAPFVVDDPAREEYYKSLQTLDPIAEEGRQARTQAAVTDAKQRAGRVSRDIATQLAQNPTQAAAALEELQGYEEEVSQRARLEAETLAMRDRAQERVVKAREAERIENERQAEQFAQEKANRERKFELIGDIGQSLFGLASAARPKTQEARLEDQAERAGERADRLRGRYEDMGPITADTTDSQLNRMSNLAGRMGAATKKQTAAQTELANLEAAKLAREKQRLAALAPFSQQLSSLMKPTG